MAVRAPDTAPTTTGFIAVRMALASAPVTVMINHHLRVEVHPGFDPATLRAHATMLQFSIGDRVTFETNEGRTVVGALVRYNKKTVSVVTDDGHRWNVSPRFLRLVEPRDMIPPADAASKK